MNNHLDNDNAAKNIPEHVIDAILATVPGAVDDNTLLFGAPGSGLAASTGFDPIAFLPTHLGNYAAAYTAGNWDEVERSYAYLSRTLSVSDITAETYAQFKHNPASMAYWLPFVHRGVTDSLGETFSIPATKILRLSPELAQYTRREFGIETNEVSVRAFDRIIEEAFALDTSAADSWFIKTGTFSNKFEFRNTRCREADEMGQYFHLLNNQAMALGAGDTVDLVVRRWIDASENTPEIYHGMPLRTELRAFVDLDSPKPRVLGVTPYWHPQVMKNALKLALDQPGVGAGKNDYRTWSAHAAALEQGFNTHRPEVTTRLEKLLPHLHKQGLRGTWSIDILVDESDAQPCYWLIDMAPMHSSALVDVLFAVDAYAEVSPTELIRAARRPESPLHSPKPSPFPAGVHNPVITFEEVRHY